MTELQQMPAYVRKAYGRLASGELLVRTSSDCEEAVTRGGGFLYSTEPGGRKFPTASGKALVEGGASLSTWRRPASRNVPNIRGGSVTMPTILRRSGPDMLQRDGTYQTPRAMVHFCETCGYEGAGFGIHHGGKLLSYCGWQNGAPVCVGKAAKDAA